MGLSLPIDDARVVCTESVHAFLRATDAFSEYELLDASRCHGWTRLDVVVHVIGGWQEMFGGLVSPVDREPSVDAASYWTAFAAAEATDDPIPTLTAQRRRTAAFARPDSARDQLRDVAAALLRGITSMPDRCLLWQGHVFAAGDFLATWAVEHVVHQLDLRSDQPAPAGGLRLARTTIDTLAGVPLPEAWSDQDAVLIGSGRIPVPDDAGPLTTRLPVLG